MTATYGQQHRMANNTIRYEKFLLIYSIAIKRVELTRYLKKYSKSNIAHLSGHIKMTV